MITKTTLAAALLSLATITAVPAQASGLHVQFGWDGPGWSGNHGHGEHGRRWRHHQRLSTDEIRWMLRGDGYRQIRFIDNNGPVYELRARKHGRSYYLVVSARTGEILSRNRI